MAAGTPAEPPGRAAGAGEEHGPADKAVCAPTSCFTLLASPQCPTTERDDGMFYHSDRGPQCASTRAEQLAGAGAEPWGQQGDS